MGGGTHINNAKKQNPSADGAIGSHGNLASNGKEENEIGSKDEQKKMCDKRFRARK